MKDIFSTYHPIINFTYFVAVILFSMFSMNPVFLGISVVASFAYSIWLNGRGAVKFNLMFIMPMIVTVAILNPLFSHGGVTILGYLGDNPITKESILYGVATGFMLASVILWFSCYNSVMTSDKFIYLFGRIMPAMSLLFSMVLRFVPRFKAQIRQISNAQKCVGRDVSSGTFLQRARCGIKILSVMITWALENSIETADSMRARGYGLRGRTSFSIYRMDSRDRGMLAIISLCILILGMGAVDGWNSMQYFPSVKGLEISGFGLLVYASYFFLCTLPLMLDVKEGIKWKLLSSKI